MVKNNDELNKLREYTEASISELKSSIEILNKNLDMRLRQLESDLKDKHASLVHIIDVYHKDMLHLESNIQDLSLVVSDKIKNLEK